MKVVLTVLSSIFLTISASANFTGFWDGKVMLSINGRPVKKCDFALAATQTATDLTIENGGISCGEVFGWIYPNHLEIDGNVLRYKNRNIGKITDSEIHVVDINSEDHQKFFVDVIQFDSNSANFYQKIIDESPKGGVIEFAGTIERDSGGSQ